MKAIELTRSGGENLWVIQRPAPRPGEVLGRMEAVSPNYPDLAIARPKRFNPYGLCVHSMGKWLRWFLAGHQ